ncbi:lysophospholipase L1-like esterase [Tamilnaduibacter salinus]|uniref:Lysophospholipase L1-like esterase n=1 Tax=Tamilnaduibacter salinus TaxID=1484056 RepID=A0A2U1D0Y0_9GAMM|nr:SGNH/GDSL hydrolase family protein [Tamilnaduibacter salinus]PVY79045.1 lysophospholipase L1-like esterase [Tamilnaduibacter salinus]
MGYWFTVALLSPFLLVQARHVRRVTPRLPEPEGVRTGIEGAGPPCRLLIMGDSAAAGVGAASQASALSGQLVGALSGQYRVEWRLHATTGHTIADLLSRVSDLPEAPFDAVLVSIGVNDVTGGTRLRQWRERLDSLCQTLSLRFGAPDIILTSVPPMEAFPALPRPLRGLLGRRARALNRVMEVVAENRQACHFLAPAFPLMPEYIAADGFHPSPVAYRLWAEQVARRLLNRVQTTP